MGANDIIKTGFVHSHHETLNSDDVKKDKTAKVQTAKTLWIPAVNNHGGFGRWAFLEINDPWGAEKSSRNFPANPEAE
ncbi:MAG: hypothetical protein ABIG11_05490 [bacterium]